MSQQNFNFGIQKPEQEQNVRTEYAAIQMATPTVAPLPLSTVNFNGAAVHGPVGSSEPVKRKRGRPKKIESNGPIAVTAAPAGVHFGPPSASTAPFAPFAHAAATAAYAAATTPFSPAAPASAPAPGAPASTVPVKKRGRPRGSVNKHRRVNEPGPEFPLTPHVITVKAGECLATKIVALSLDVRSNVCILSANGAISRVTLRQPSSGSVTYEGRFEILTLGGSLLLYDNSGPSHRSSGLSVSLSGPDGHVVGGGVMGELIAASAVQVVLLSFPGEYCNVPKLANQMGNSSASPKFANAGQSSSPSQGTLSESSDGPGSPHNPSS
ncbi:hypothetical protein TanjilG_05103 [Lupinus angustifolius]|uniref:AT-hook motif nuclear-localized protein n=2 Tax=Lupinus angustifolius TaxID=3871 RepID=A0A1J7G7A3_LUPAN|nr:PREDICTED: AT-hook motif nuclear-localized protein 10-like isoform X2 [Lupinus angustifolius]XP_019416923.1 PREDICTED: AT-hook motif nuclear-localized protein 10-like isoform X2 [Lupinus angustifolius]OIV96263.1 hypothetical protein TanjilG_05103 [Lupinus angustifolius]